MSQGNNRSSNSTKREEKLKPTIPNDLIIEIFSRLPGKSIARFYCLSKLWCSMLHRPYFTELFLTLSSSRPRVLFVIKEAYDVWSIFSSPQLQNLHGNSSLVVAAKFHMRFHVKGHRNICSYASGLVYFSNVWTSEDDEDTMPVICNPITGQYAVLPNLIKHTKSSVLGFDPINKRFKVLVDASLGGRRIHKILTLGTVKLSWRATKNSCPSYNYSVCEEICINGVWYYLVDGCNSNEHIVCIDVRSEEFKLIDVEGFCNQYQVKLINYKGRLGVVSWEYNVNTLELCMRVLEDVEKQEWSKCVYSLGENDVVDPGNDYIGGVTASGEIVISMKYMYDDEPFYVHYFNPERNTLQRVEIKGFEKHSGVYVFVDHVEDLNVNDVKQLKLRRPLIKARPKYH